MTSTGKLPRAEINFGGNFVNPGVILIRATKILPLRQMIMAIRAVICVLLLLAPVLYAQDNSLERPASDFSSSGAGITETLLNFAHQQNLRIAVEYVDQGSLDQPITVNLHD